MGFFQTIIDKYKIARQKELNKEEFKKALFQAVSDGKLTSEEISELDRKKAEVGFTEVDYESRGFCSRIFGSQG